MVDLFATLFLMSGLAGFVGFLKPSLFTRITGGTRKWTSMLFGALTFIFFLLVGATTPPAEPKVASQTTETTPTTSENNTTSPSGIVAAPNHGGIFAKVVNVVDGDTIKIDTGETVRYIGIDTPETVHPDKPVQCYGKEASTKNTELVEGKTVELEKDVSDKDRYGRLLRYIWVGDTLINEVLVREGYAHSSTYPPDVKHQDRFVQAQRLAREEGKGLWNAVCADTPTPTRRPTIASTPRPTQAVVQSNTGGTSVNNTPAAVGGAYTCNCSKTCSQMSSCAEAQYQLNSCGCSARDADDDGIACDSDCQ